MTNEERYKLSMDYTGIGMFEWNLDRNEIFYSPVWKKLLGYEDNELPNSLSTWEKLTDPLDAKKIKKMQQELITTERDTFKIEYRMRHKKGGWVDILSCGKAVYNAENRVVRILGTHIDISQRKKKERELTLKNSALENSLNGFFIINHRRKIIYVNKAFAQNYGYKDKQEMVGMDSVLLFEKPGIITSIIHILQQKGEFISENRAKKKDGTLFDLLIYARLAYDFEGNEIYPTTCIDVSKQNESLKEKAILEEELIQAHKMEALGTLAGGIAHDFNNILSSIIGFSELSLNVPDLNPVLKDYLHEIFNSGLRAKELTKQILTFARKSDEEQKPVQPLAVIEEIIKFLRSSIPANIKIEKKLESMSYVMGNPTQLHRVLLNLCTNASDAMAETGGTLLISLEELDVNGKTKRPYNLPKGEFVVIRVSDTGTGIDPAIIKKIFQPYFTTKEKGKGTGMGLALVHGIVESYGGKLTVASKLGEGTTFSVYLPVTHNDYDDEIKLFEELPTGNERILFIDDETSITKLAKQNLTDLGYDVTDLNSSSDALTLFMDNPYDFDLVITDMTMPGIMGDKISSQFIKIRPDIPIILCTGYSNQIIEDKVSKIGIKALLYKPLTKRELALKIREILDSKEKPSNN